jgi:16S rRNA (uracil1498-N3)-methyltransferase
MPSSPRIHCVEPLSVGTSIDLPDAAARHVQVLRLQPGDTVTLFGGARPDAGSSVAAAAGEFVARIERMGRNSVRVRIEQHDAIEREARRTIHLAIGMPANERMDWLIEKATELGVASVQPLMTERTVVRLDPARAARRTQHWSAIAAAACEQCGRNQVPEIWPPLALSAWFGASAQPMPNARYLLSFRPGAQDLSGCRASATDAEAPAVVLCGPEGGLTPAEEASALAQGFVAMSLGARVLRAETAALAALTLLG